MSCTIDGYGCMGEFPILPWFNFWKNLLPKASCDAPLLQIYLLVFLLRWTGLRDRMSLPTKKSFYYYVAFLALLNVLQSIGAGLLLEGVDGGLCVVDVTAYVYFSLLTPLVYRTFLSEFFGYEVHCFPLGTGLSKVQTKATCCHHLIWRLVWFLTYDLVFS